MSDSAILFSGPMIQALLDGRKTQTRRVLKPQPDAGSAVIADTVMGPKALLARAKYKAGDRLWVREAHALLPRLAYRISIGTGTIAQREHPTDGYSAAVFREGFDRAGAPPWRPSIHMPRWASRITLFVTDVRVERLLKISEADAIAEGVAFMPFPAQLGVKGMAWSADGISFGGTPPLAFFQLWETINGSDALDADPWVSVISFEVLRANIDEASNHMEKIGE